MWICTTAYPVSSEKMLALSLENIPLRLFEGKLLCPVSLMMAKSNRLPGCQTKGGHARRLCSKGTNDCQS